MSKPVLSALCGALLLSACSSVPTGHTAKPHIDSASISQAYSSTETSAQKKARMADWERARFGLFIHWGAYSVLDGEFEGRRQNSPLGEHIMRNLQIPPSTYRETVVPQFNPAAFNASKWTQKASDAGMQYLVMTTKHHDGFALFASEISDYNIVDQTDFGRDVIAELASAAKSDNLMFGIYYSQAQDWYHPGGYRPQGRWSAEQDGDYDVYFQTLVKGQIRELLTRHDVDIIWWDSARQTVNPELALEVARELVALEPGIVVNPRLSLKSGGDYQTYEQVIPGIAPEGYFELCLTHNRSWSYRPSDQDWKSDVFLLQTLSHMSSIGGNFLFNVGPKPSGAFPSETLSTLDYFSDWMAVNGEAIHGTQASPYYKLDFGRATQRQTADGLTLYLHVWAWPENGKLRMPGLREVPQSLSLLGGTAQLSARADGDDMIISGLPNTGPHPAISIIRVDLPSGTQIAPGYIHAGPKGTLTLAAQSANMTIKPQFDCVPELMRLDGDIFISNWKNCYQPDRAPHSSTRAHWKVDTTKAQRYKITARLAIAGDKPLPVRFEGPNFKERIDINLAPTGGADSFTTRDLGELTLPAGVSTLTFGGQRKADWPGVRLVSVTLTPIASQD